MTPKPALRRGSVRTQLVLWNIAALALLLGALGLIVRYTVSSTILASVDRELDQRTRRPGGGHGRPPFGGGPGFPGGDASHAFPGHDGHGGFAGPDGFPGHDHPAGPPPHDESDPYHPRFFDLKGRPLNPNGQDMPWDAVGLDAAREGDTVHRSVVQGGVPLRVVSHPIPGSGYRRGVIQAAYPLTDVNRAIAGLDRALLTLIPLGLLGAGLGGAFLTDRVLRRVQRLTQAAGRFSASDFSHRLPVSGRDEFSELAETFNALLERQQAAFDYQKRLIAQQRRFTADASHELKTPLTIIKGNTSLALSSNAALDRQSLCEIDEAAATMSRLVQDLLLLARSDAGHVGQGRVELLVREVLERAIVRTARADIPVDLTVTEEALTVCGDEEELVRLFSNLLDNAVRYTPPGGQVSVTACREEKSVAVAVADRGVGIAPEHLPHLGERFYRVDRARARPDGGTGLGLSICKSIAEAHGGTLGFESVVGTGTTVTVRLPAAE